jgi:hypothetical protein
MLTFAVIEVDPPPVSLTTGQNIDACDPWADAPCKKGWRHKERVLFPRCASGNQYFLYKIQKRIQRRMTAMQKAEAAVQR